MNSVAPAPDHSHRTASLMSVAIVCTLLVLTALATVCGRSRDPEPPGTGPSPSAPPGDPSRNYPFFATNHDLAKWGYVEEEFFIEGTATATRRPRR